MTVSGSSRREWQNEIAKEDQSEYAVMKELVFSFQQLQIETVSPRESQRLPLD